MEFESEFPSANTYCQVRYPKLLAYFSISQPLFMEFDQLLVREQASTTVPNHLRILPISGDWCASPLDICGECCRPWSKGWMFPGAEARLAELGRAND